MNEPVWIRTSPGRRENLMSAGAGLLAAAGVGVVTWWLVRTLASRERVDLRPERLPPRSEERGREE